MGFFEIKRKDGLRTVANFRNGLAIPSLQVSNFHFPMGSGKRDISERVASSRVKGLLEFVGFDAISCLKKLLTSVFKVFKFTELISRCKHEQLPS